MLTFVTGFFLVSPFLALGLYHLSRHRELGDNVNYTDSLLAFRIRKFDMVLLVTFHAIVMVAWICLVTLLGALYFGGTDASIAVLSEKLFHSGEGAGMQMLFIISGRILAVLVFVVSVVSWPMLLDRDKDVINAVATSIQIVNDNNWSCWCGRF